MTRIVVGIDGSKGSLKALGWAAEEARLRGASLHLLHSWKFPPVSIRVSAGEEMPHVDLEATANQVLDTAEASIEGTPPIQISREIANDLPAQALVRASDTSDLIVVGSRGMGGFKGLLLGSVAQQVAQHSRCPVVIVPSERT